MDSSSTRLRRFRDAVRAALTDTELESETENKEDHYRIIQMHYSQLLNSLTSVGDIVAELFQTGNLTELERESIQSLDSTPIRASTELLNIVMKTSCHVYESFLIALKNANQQNAYRILTANSQDQDLFTCQHYRLVRNHYDWLTKNIECDTGLIARLFEKGVLTIREFEYIGSKTEKFRKNETFPFIISRKSSEDFGKFRKALIETGQNSVVEKLKLSPKNDDAQSNDCDEHRFLIQRNFCWLAETIDPHSGLIDLLYQNEVITFRERETITAEMEAVKTNESLLKIISHKSKTDFEQFKNVLSETKQDHLARRLMEDRPKMTLGSSERQNTRKVIDKEPGFQYLRKSDVPANPRNQTDGEQLIQKPEVSAKYRPEKQKTSGPRVPPKPGKQDVHVKKSRLKTNVSATAYPPKAEPQKSRSISFLNKNFEKLESYLRFEISLKIAALHGRKIGTSQNVLLGSVQTILSESLTMKKKQEAENSLIFKQELEETKLKALSSELRSVKQSLAKEERRRREIELQNRKTNELYEQLKKQFEKQAMDSKTDGDLWKEYQEVEDYKRRLNDRDRKIIGMERKFNEITKESQDQKAVVEQLTKRIASLCQETEQNDLRMKDEEENFAKLKSENRHLIEECKNLEAKLKDIELRFYSAENIITTPSLIHELKAKAALLGKEAIESLAILENELFLMYCAGAEIEVFDTMSYQVLRKLQIPCISMPWDMTAGKIDKCLFVIGVKHDINAESIIGKFDVYGELLDPWPKPSGGTGGHVSVYETSLIACLWDESIINEFSQTGNLIRTVKLSTGPGTTRPFHAFKMTSMHYVVSLGRKNDDLVRIWVVDLDGNIKKECTKWDQRLRLLKNLFRNHKNIGRRGMQCNGLIHFIEYDNGSLLVSDLGNNNIFLLSSALEYKRTLIQFPDEELPETVSFNETKNKLFVATNVFEANGTFMSSRVLIYKV